MTLRSTLTHPAVTMSAALTIGAALIAPSALAQHEAASCPANVIVAFPGTGETNDNADPNAQTGMLANVTKPLTDGTTTQAYYVPYPAIAVDPGRAMTYAQSKKIGVDNATKAITDRISQCSSTHFSLTGYSQGADAAGDLAAAIGGGKSPIPADKVTGVALLSDPGQSEGDKGVGAQASTGFAGGRGGLGALEQRATWVCDPDDIYCHTPADKPALAMLGKLGANLDLSDPVRSVTAIVNALSAGPGGTQTPSGDTTQAAAPTSSDTTSGGHTRDVVDDRSSTPTTGDSSTTTASGTPSSSTASSSSTTGTASSSTPATATGSGSSAPTTAAGTGSTSTGTPTSTVTTGTAASTGGSSTSATHSSTTSGQSTPGTGGTSASGSPTSAAGQTPTGGQATPAQGDNPLAQLLASVQQAAQSGDPKAAEQQLTKTRDQVQTMGQSAGGAQTGNEAGPLLDELGQVVQCLTRGDLVGVVTRIAGLAPRVLTFATHVAGNIGQLVSKMPVAEFGQLATTATGIAAAVATQNYAALPPLLGTFVGQVSNVGSKVAQSGALQELPALSQTVLGQQKGGDLTGQAVDFAKFLASGAHTSYATKKLDSGRTGTEEVSQFLGSHLA